ncbi:MAG: hypothetical protein ABI652_07660, partial [Acidobacteriota bacterium]
MKGLARRPERGVLLSLQGVIAAVALLAIAVHLLLRFGIRPQGLVLERNDMGVKVLSVAPDVKPTL